MASRTLWPGRRTGPPTPLGQQRSPAHLLLKRESPSLAAEVTSSPIALVTVLSRTRQWFKARVGLEITQTPREWAFCSHTVLHRGLFEVEDAAADPRFSDNPLVTGLPHIRFYAGYPFRDEDGRALGALCVIDQCQRKLSPGQARAIRELAAIASDEARLNRLVQS